MGSLKDLTVFLNIIFAYIILQTKVRIVNLLDRKKNETPPMSDVVSPDTPSAQDEQ